MHRPDKQIGWPTLAGLGLIVIAFMALSLCVTATGTARAMASMGYDAMVGYAVGVIFDIAKGVLPVGLLALWWRRARGTAALLGIAWMCLVAYSCLATHATVSTAISGTERIGTWRMETRASTKAELASVEQQLAVLSRPMPRPAKTVREALAGERVPPGVWKDSQECGSIQESVHFARACAQVVQLRRELAAAEDYERLSIRAAELRKGLEAAPIVATADPLPAAFSATLGRVLPMGGTEGVAILVTMVVEIISCFGLASLSALSRGTEPRGHSGTLRQVSLPDAQQEAANLKVGPQAALPRPKLMTLPKPSLKAANSGCTASRGRPGREGRNPPSNVIPMRPLSSPEDFGKGGLPIAQGGPARGLSVIGSHVPAFAQERLQSAPGASLAAKDLRSAYLAWCTDQGHEPLSQPKLAVELKALGYDKWKSCGLIRYRGLQLVA